MLVGETLQLQAQISPSNATDKTLMWGSSKQSVATVSDAGLVTAVGEGSAKITVTAGGKTATCQVTVTKPAAPVVNVERVTLDNTEATLEIGETLTLTATVLPENADDKSVSWQSSGPAIAEVDQNGKVTAVSEGSATITATAGGKSATCQITVTKPDVPVETIHVESVSLDKTDANLEIGQTMTLTATVLPENADDKSVTWASTNPVIAEVDQNGNVTAIISGTVTITATTTDEGIVAGCEVTVTATEPPQPPVEEEFDGEENGHRYVDLGLPSGLKWATRNVGANSPVDYGGFYAWGETAVKSEYSWDNYIFCRNGNYVDLSKYSISGYGIADNKAELDPEDDAAQAIMGDKWFTPTKEEMQELMDNCDFTWTEQDGVRGYKVESKTNHKSIFLPATGNKVFALQDYVGSAVCYWTSSVRGEVPYYAWSLNSLGNQIALNTELDRLRGCPVRAVTGRPVKVVVESISLDKSQVQMYPGEQITLVATVLPDNAYDPTVTWTTSTPGVVTVDGGILTAIAEGEAVITATAGDKSATCTVTVSRSVVHVESVNLDKTDASLEIGATLTLTATVLPDNADDKTVTWASTNPAVADVDQNGLVTAISAGTVTITATTTDGGKVAGCEVTVAAAFIPVESVTFEHGELICFPGDSYPLKVTVLPENATNKTITWSSSDANVVSVTQDGLVSGHAEGLVTITAKAGDKEATCIIHCVHNPDEPPVVEDEYDGEEDGHKYVDLRLPSGLKWAVCNIGALSSSEVGSNFEWGETFARQYSYDPPYTLKDPSTQKLTKYVISAEDGEVDNLTTLELCDDAAHVQWGGLWRMPTRNEVVELIDNCDYEFVQQNGVWGAKLTSKHNSHSIFLAVNNVTTGMYYTSTLDEWSSWYVKYLSFKDGWVGTGMVVRQTMASIRPVNGVPAPIEIHATSITIDQQDIVLNVGWERDLTATVLPANTTDQVTWGISDIEIAAIDPVTGHLKALKKGTATITAFAGNQTATATLTVNNPVQRIDLNRTSMEITRGEQIPLTATIYPAGADNPTLVWVSSDSSIASVDRYEGIVWARQVGSAVITCINESAGVTASCNVTVVSPGAPYISLDQDNFTVDAAASEDIQIPYRIVNPDGSSLQVNVTEGSDWLKIKQIGGLYFYVYQNTGVSSRTGKITLTYGSTTTTVTVIQSGKVSSGPSDIVFSTGFDPNANNAINAAGDNTCVILASVVNPVEGIELQMSSDVPWMTNFRSGSTPDVYYFAASKNTTGRMRTGHVTLTYGDVTKVVKFVQMADEVIIILNPADMTFNYEARTVSFDVTLPDGCDYNGLNVTPGDNYNWITNLGVNGRTVTFNLKENNDTNAMERTARIKVSYDGQSSYFNVTQTLDAPEVDLVDRYSVSYLGQKVYMVAQITNPRSDVQLSTHVVGGNLDWIYSNPGGTVTVQQNTSGKTRSAQVEVSYGNFAKKTVTVTQTSSQTEIRSTVSEITFDSIGSIDDWVWCFDVRIIDPLPDTEFEVSAADPWVSVVIDSQHQEVVYTLIVSVRKNYWPAERTSSVILTYGDFHCVIPVIQEAGDDLPLGFVDLGLPSGTLWAQTNLGAANEYNFGNYYAWGETSPKTKYTWFNYKWGSGSTPWNNITKYNATDGKDVLDASDDAATAANSAWSTPTKAQWQELMDYCDAEWVLTPVEGMRFTSRDNQESIFLPAAGWKADDDAPEVICLYWTKNLGFSLEATSDGFVYLSPATRYYGLPIRPVRQR